MSSEQMERELLELAAKAAGYDTSHRMNRERMELDPPVAALWVRDDKGLIHTGWNPLESDADALRLAVKLGIIIAPPAYNGGWQATASAKADEIPWVDETAGSHEQATRRCIVRAAAQLAKGAEK